MEGSRIVKGTSDWILAAIQITVQIQELYEGFLIIVGQGQVDNFLHLSLLLFLTDSNKVLQRVFDPIYGLFRSLHSLSVSSFNIDLVDIVNNCRHITNRLGMNSYMS